ncbi:MAG TPA: hypothetical protein VMT87_10455 [Vicinamibacteria bacterium]|nr:hypothetical protein [Vicinamibacteria bacterium]
MRNRTAQALDVGLLANWTANRAAVHRLLLTVGVPLSALVFRYAGARRAAAVATRPPRVEAMPGVERECLAIMARRPRP